MAGSVDLASLHCGKDAAARLVAVTAVVELAGLRMGAQIGHAAGEFSRLELAQTEFLEAR